MAWKNSKTVRLGSIQRRDLDIPISPHLDAVLGKLHAKGQTPLIVGGAVRDALLGQKPKDIDVEVYHSSYDDLADTLKDHGKVNLVGKAFGVIKFTDPDKNEYDFSLPRRDNKTGVGHKDFKSEFDPDITPPEAAARRDFTFNSLAYDPVKKELHDYYGGEKDLRDRVIRHTSDAFTEDPLRVLRGMQLASRIGMTVHPDTAKLSQSIAHEYSTIPKERVSEEWMKLATKGKEPGRAIDYLKDTGWHDNFPELKDCYGVKQEPSWHPEGTLDQHMKYSMDAAAKIADRDGLKGDDRAVTVLGAMCHDFGKPSTTSIDDEGRIISHGHDTAGGPIARSFLEGIGIKKDITDKVVPIVENHMQHLNFEKNISSRTVRRLAERLHPANITELSRIMEADHSGRPPLEGGMPSGAQKMLEKAKDSNVSDKKQDRLIEGRDVMPYFDNKPGKHIGEGVKDAYEAQLNGEINNKEEAQAWLQKRYATKEPFLGFKQAHELDDPFLMAVHKPEDELDEHFDTNLGTRVFPDFKGPELEHHILTEHNGSTKDHKDIHWDSEDSDWTNDRHHYHEQQFNKRVSHLEGWKNAPKLGSWKDVQNKAVRLRNSNLVNLINVDENIITSRVIGDHDIYDVALWRQFPGSQSITTWDCDCEWGRWAFKRKHTFVGRLCSHALATLYEAHGRERKKTSKTSSQEDFEPETEVTSKLIKRLGVLKEHEPHDIMDEAAARKHMLRKHVDNNDHELKDAINGLGDGEVQNFHDEDHQFFSEHGWDHEPAKEWDDDKEDGYSTSFAPTKPVKPKSAEDYVRDVEPGEKREGDDFEYDTRWFNKDLNSDVLDTVKALRESYPVTKDWFRGLRVSDKGPSACVVSQDRAIWMPPNSLDKPGQTSYKYKHDKDEKEGVSNSLVAHEFGHVLQASIIKHEVGDDPSLHRTMDDLMTGNYKDEDLQHKDSAATYLLRDAENKFPNAHVSGYAETNQREKFAEIMRKHWTEHPSRHDDQTKHVASGIDFLYHKDGLGWGEQKDGGSDWLDRIRLLKQSHQSIAKTGASSRATLIIYPNSGREIKVNVEVVQDTESISQGLMNRPMLPMMSGMVFNPVYIPSYSGMWMMNCLIPLTVMFWNKNGIIMEVIDMEPCISGKRCPVYNPKQPWYGAVEVNKGFAQKFGITVGNRVELIK